MSETDPLDKEAKARLEEATQFVVINKTAKGVRSDLAEDYLRKIQLLDPTVVANLPARVTSGIEWKPMAIDLAEYLNDNSPVWKERIRFPNEPIGTTTVTQVSFTDSLKPILQNDSFKQFSKGELAKILDSYWSAIYKHCPEAFDNPDDYVIQRSAGCYVLHKVLPKVLSYAAVPGEKLTQKKIEDVLEGLEAMESEYWNVNKTAGLIGTSFKAFGILSSRISADLDKKMEEKQPAKGMRPFEI
ncbi:MAG: hypothetical protein JRN59_06270 [Nitrososphaerota archaeon]|nr:hypothetical protein [Nitrososphaerota archaeon]